MKIKLSFIALLTCFSCFSQNYQLDWGPVVKTKQRVIDIYGVRGDAFYASSNGKRRGYAMLRYNNYAQSSVTFFKCLVNEKPTAYEGQYELGDKIFTFTSRYNDEGTSKTLYAHEFRESVAPAVIEGKKIVSFDFEKENRRRSDFTLLVSENNERLCVTYQSSQRKNKLALVYGYYILDENLKVESEGSFEDILEPGVESVINYKLSNDGELFMLTRVKKKDEPEFMKFYKIEENEVKTVEVDLEGNYASQLRIAIDKNDNFVVTGFYGKPYEKGVSKGTGVKGVFYAILDPSTEEIISSGFNEFDDEFIMEGLSEKQKEKTEKNKERKGIEPSLHNFHVRYFEATEDGGSFGLAEEYYVIITTYRDPKTGSTTTTYTYYYNDLIAFKLNKEGEMEWNKKIQKTQVSTNDGGYFSSVSMQRSGNHFYLLFNDNIKNYDLVSMKYLKGEYPVGMKISPKSNVIAYVDIDLASGDYERTAFEGQKEIGAILVPKLCHPEKDEPSILLYTTKGSAQRVGRITFNK